MLQGRDRLSTKPRIALPQEATMAQKIVDWVMLVAVLICCLAFMWSYMSRVDRFVFGSDCNIVMPGISGTFCQGREADGSIYYYNKKLS